MNKTLIALCAVSILFTACGFNPNTPIKIDKQIQQDMLLGKKQFYTIESREGVKQNIFIESYTKNPKAIVLLFTGGKGILDLSQFGAADGRNNFVIRTQDYLLDNNYMTVMIDAPSDKQDKSGITGGFRNSLEHSYDIKSVLTYLETYNKPIWLSGTSRGTESVAFLATQLNDKIDGIIISSSITVDSRKGNSILSLALGNITVPAYVIAHKDDQCSTTPPSNLQSIVNGLKNSKNVLSKIYEGGDFKQNNPCKALTYHGFYQIEEEVLKDIIQFIDQNNK